MNRTTLPTEEELEARLRRGDVSFPPLTLIAEAPRGKQRDTGPDAIVRLAWAKKSFRFAAKCKRLSNPKAVGDQLALAIRSADERDLLPLVVAPYLGEPALDMLENAQVSGIDLCGNGMVIVPGELYVRRTGAPNPFRADGAIKNVYRKSSSVVARLFLARPEFDSLQSALDELVRRGGGVTLATVSKVCKALENDLIVERKRDGQTRLRLLQPDKLLERLGANYTPPAITTRVSGKLRGLDSKAARELLRDWAEKTGNRVAASGTSSVSAYAVMARDGAEDYYCTDVGGAVRLLGDRFQPSDRFATINLLETRDEEVYFDRRADLTASPVQSFLELFAGDKRDRDTAEQVRKVILGGVSPRKG
jgi:hypothetical protein